MSEQDRTPEDPLPALIAALDQTLMLAPQLARAAHGFFEVFVAEGFNDRQALYLTAAQILQDPGQAP